MMAVFNEIPGSIDIYMSVLRAICGDANGKSMVDLGCCFAPNTPKLGFEKRIYIDIIQRNMDHKFEQENFRQLDILLADKYYSGFDVSIASDVIEHLTVKDGFRLVSVMRNISAKQIIFTPLGKLWVEETPSDDPEAHRSGWYPEMLPRWASVVFPDYHRGWAVGAFFSWHCDDIEKDFERVKSLIDYKNLLHISNKTKL